MDIGVAVSTFGSDEWQARGTKTLRTMLDTQTVRPADYITTHMPKSLGGSRNCSAKYLTSEWIIFLDADDQLDVHYIEFMNRHLEQVNEETDLVQPSTLGVYPDGTEDDYPVLIPKRNLLESNYLVIGSMVRHSMFDEVGQFDLSLPVLEDWDLWIRMFKAGARITACPEAVYRVGVNPDSRNSEFGLHHQYYGQIRNKYA